MILPKRPHSVTKIWLLFATVAIACFQFNAKAAPDPNSPLGINLSAVQDYSDEDSFVDYFKMSREWIPQCEVGVDAGCTWNNAWDTGEQSQIQVDANGWVKKLPLRGDSPLFSRVSTLMMVAGDPHNHYAGTYVVLYDGEGTLTYSLGGTRVSGAPGRDVISVADTGNVLLTINRTDPGGANNYIRNIRVVRQELEAQLPNLVFNPTWIAKLAPFRTLRFMDWMQTNGSTQHDFANRPLLTNARYTTLKGVPLEMMVKLSNTVLAEPWFTLPHRATDDYITRFATQVRDILDARLKVYIEYSNEVWNGAFEQGAEIESWAQTEFPGGTDSGFTKRINWHGKRTADLCRLWKTVFGSQSQRVVCVLGAQAANSWTASEALDCPLWQTDANNPNPGQSCKQQGIDAVAIAPYFGGYLGDPAIASQVRALSLDQLFREITTGGVINDPNPGDWFVIPRGGALSEAYGWMNAYDDLGVSRSIRIVAYEGGQHLVGVGSSQWDATIRDLFFQANRDTRMGTAYSSYLEYWRTGTANDRLELFSAFSLAGRYGEFGSWGALEYIEQPVSPKYEALSEFAYRQPCWWNDCLIMKAAQDALTVSANPASLVSGDAGITLSVTGGCTGGSVTYAANGTSGLTCRISGNTLTATGSAGTCSVTATMAGNQNYEPVTSATLDVPVTAANVASRLINIATRGQVGTGDNVLIGGFVISGTQPKKVLIRAIGPSMANVAGILANPQMTLTKVTGELVGSNDDWASGANAAQIHAMGRAPTDSRESALLLTLEPNVPYTPIISGVGNTTGVALVEVYDVDEANVDARLINIATRGQVGTGDNVLIGGFVINGTQPKKVLIRVIGPSMAGVAGTLANPQITLTSVTGEWVGSNDDWASGSNAAQIQAMGRAPIDSREPAMLVTLEPNIAYTPIVSGVGNTTGVALVEIYDVDEPNVDSLLINIATRGQIGTGDNVLIGGFVISGTQPKKVLIRAIGPSMTSVAGTLADPRITLYKVTGEFLESNDNWGDSPKVTEIVALNMQPLNNSESAMLVTLPLGPYTPIVSGVDDAAGVGLVEVYEVP